MKSVERKGLFHNIAFTHVMKVAIILHDIHALTLFLSTIVVYSNYKKQSSDELDVRKGTKVGLVEREKLDLFWKVRTVLIIPLVIPASYPASMSA